MTRAEVAAAVAARIPTQLADAGMAGTDTPGALKEPIDDALRGLGVAEAALATATSDDPVGFVALVKFFALKAVEARIGDRFDVGTGGDSYKLSQTVANVRALIARAEQELAVLFGGVPSGGATVVAYDGAFLEPAAAR